MTLKGSFTGRRRRVNGPYRATNRSAIFIDPGLRPGLTETAFQAEDANGPPGVRRRKKSMTLKGSFTGRRRRVNGPFRATNRFTLSADPGLRPGLIETAFQAEDRNGLSGRRRKWPFRCGQETGAQREPVPQQGYRSVRAVLLRRFPWHADGFADEGHRLVRLDARLFRAAAEDRFHLFRMGGKLFPLFALGFADALTGVPEASAFLARASADETSTSFPSSSSTTRA